MAYEINYEDQRFQDVEKDKQNAMSEVEKTYSGMINSSDAYYQNQINAVKDWEKEQSKIQQEQTDFAVEKIEQQREQTQKDYIREQSGAYVDWQKQSNQYGVEAEQKAAQGMAGTGYSESSQVGMYNAYQNRVATARESYNLAVQNFNNGITEAVLKNSAALAEIKLQAFQQQLELSLQGFQYKNQLLIEKADKLAAVESEYHDRYQEVLAQINHENALAEQIRQHNASLALQQAQLAEQQRQYNASLAEDQRQFNASMAAEGYNSDGSAKKQLSTPVFSGNTYSEALKFVKEYAPSKSTSGLMTKSEWTRRKNNGSTLNSVKNYSSYEAYLRAYVYSAIS